MNEVWKEVIGYEGLYQVSNIGRVMRTKSGRGAKAGNIKSNGHSLGYCYVSLCKEGVAKHHYVHRLVAAAFIGECPQGAEVNHIDCDKENNRFDNLEYVTPLENIRHAIKQGRMTPRLKGRLSEQEVKSILALHAEGISQSEIGRRYRVTQSQVSLIVRGKQYIRFLS